MTQRSGELMTGSEPPYEIPDYQPGMPYCKSRQKYLRPTLLCQSNAPEIIAMANKLGAFQKSPRQYAESCFDFVRRNIQFSILQSPAGAVKALRTGRAMCLDKVGLFVALCRAGGIPARYRICKFTFIFPANEMITADSIVTREWYNTVGKFMIHGAGEVLIDGKWWACDGTQSPELEAGFGLPLLNFGDDASFPSIYRRPGNTMHFESLLPGFVLSLSIFMMLERGILMPIEIRLREMEKRGKKILAELGEEEYNRRAKQNQKATLTEVSRKLFLALEKAGET